MSEEIEIIVPPKYFLNDCIQLLNSFSLPTSDVEKHFSNFRIFELKGVLLGVIGVELYPPYALLRSLAIKPEWQNKGLASNLVDLCLEIWPTEEKITEIYLLTQTAQKFFEQKGFQIVERDVVPKEIQETEEFMHACPKSAIVMMKKF
jgi:amino-acid N-acetyltransferase